MSALFLLFSFKYLHDTKRANNKVVQISEDKCTNCRRCLKKCRRHVIDSVNDEIVVKYPNQCTACGDCVVVCKFGALSIVQRNF